jgi:hypothetical protein
MPGAYRKVEFGVARLALKSEMDPEEQATQMKVILFYFIFFGIW